VASKFHIEELRNGPRVTVRREFEPLKRLLVSDLAGVITGMGTATVFGGWWWTASAPIAALIAVASVRTQNAELEATKFELVARVTWAAEHANVLSIREMFADLNIANRAFNLVASTL
jgi:hypothetical protein